MTPKKFSRNRENIATLRRHIASQPPELCGMSRFETATPDGRICRCIQGWYRHLQRPLYSNERDIPSLDRYLGISPAIETELVMMHGTDDLATFDRQPPKKRRQAMLLALVFLEETGSPRWKRVFRLLGIRESWLRRLISKTRSYLNA